MDGGVSGRLVSASVGNDREDAESGGDYAVGADGLSIADSAAAGSAGLSQSEGSHFESRGKEVGVLYTAEVLSEEGEFVSALSKAWKKAQMGLGPWELLLG